MLVEAAYMRVKLHLLQVVSMFIAVGSHRFRNPIGMPEKCGGVRRNVEGVPATEDTVREEFATDKITEPYVSLSNHHERPLNKI